MRPPITEIMMITSAIAACHPTSRDQPFAPGVVSRVCNSEEQRHHYNRHIPVLRRQDFAGTALLSALQRIHIEDRCRQDPDDG